jgi:hypothetical protein
VQIKYEDGDSETISLKELKRILSPEKSYREGNRARKPARTAPAPSGDGSPVGTAPAAPTALVRTVRGTTTAMRDLLGFKRTPAVGTERRRTRGQHIVHEPPKPSAAAGSGAAKTEGAAMEVKAKRREGAAGLSEKQKRSKTEAPKGGQHLCSGRNAFSTVVAQQQLRFAPRAFRQP